MDWKWVITRQAASLWSKYRLQWCSEEEFCDVQWPPKVECVQADFEFHYRGAGENNLRDPQRNWATSKWGVAENDCVLQWQEMRYVSQVVSKLSARQAVWRKMLQAHTVTGCNSSGVSFSSLFGNRSEQQLEIVPLKIISDSYLQNGGH